MLPQLQSMLTQRMTLPQLLAPQEARPDTSAVKPKAPATVYCQQDAWVSVLSFKVFGLMGRSWTPCGTQAVRNLENMVSSFCASGLQ